MALSMMMRHHTLTRLIFAAPSLLLSACGNLSYYAHLARGEHELLNRRVAITQILKDESRDAALRERLKKVLDARAYAVWQLDLPDNRSYTQYADLQRPYVVWNVFAAPELSLEPVEHCFLFVGCLDYRGYFNRADADAKADELKAQGNEVYVAGVPAYSTLGWFDDPVINSMMYWSDEVLIGTVFHELAHQKFYVKNDSAFNESFASFVEDEGLHQYLLARGAPSEEHQLHQQRQQQFVRLVMSARERLDALYRARLAPEEMRRRKQEEFTKLDAGYRQLRDEIWNGYTGYDRWFDGGLNNAKLLPFGLYDEWVPAFAALYAQQNRSWPAFYAAVEQLARQPEEIRIERLKALRALAEASGGVRRSQ